MCGCGGGEPPGRLDARCMPGHRRGPSARRPAGSSSAASTPVRAVRRPPPTTSTVVDRGEQVAHAAGGRRRCRRRSRTRITAARRLRSRTRDRQPAAGRLRARRVPPSSAARSRIERRPTPGCGAAGEPGPVVGRPRASTSPPTARSSTTAAPRAGVADDVGERLGRDPVDAPARPRRAARHCGYVDDLDLQRPRAGRRGRAARRPGRGRRGSAGRSPWTIRRTSATDRLRSARARPRTSAVALERAGVLRGLRA